MIEGVGAKMSKMVPSLRSVKFVLLFVQAIIDHSVSDNKICGTRPGPYKIGTGL